MTLSEFRIVVPKARSMGNCGYKARKTAEKGELAEGHAEPDLFGATFIQQPGT